jgi:hypothetical protein
MLAAPEPVLLQKRNSFCIVLPSTGNEMAAPSLRVAFAQFGETRFRPCQRLRLDAGPFILGNTCQSIDGSSPSSA